MTSYGKIFLIPTPLADDTHQQVLSTQVKEVVAMLDYFFVEEIRTARRFISSLKTGKPIEQLHFYELNKDTLPEHLHKDFDSIPKSADIGILSEAGCPGIADPGAMAVAYAHKLGRQVVPLSGPSSILLALMASGFNGQSFAFHGYLPIDKIDKIKAIKQLERDAKSKNQTQIFMETPYRNLKMLEEILPALQPDTKLCIAAGLTSKDEFIKTKRVKEWGTQLPNIHKIPCIFIIQ